MGGGGQNGKWVPVLDRKGVLGSTIEWGMGKEKKKRCLFEVGGGEWWGGGHTDLGKKGK